MLAEVICGENTGGYLSELVSKTFNLYAYEPKSSNWLGGWTLLYWGWWLSWSPFVGMFIALDFPRANHSASLSPVWVVFRGFYANVDDGVW